MSRLVVDAPNAVESDAFFNAAESAGVPFLVDPLTVLLQGTVRDGDRWLSLSYARQEVVDPDQLHRDLPRLVEQTVQVQVDANATVVIPPYFVVDRPDAPTFALALEAIELTADFCRSNGIGLRLMPLLCAQIRAFGPENTWPAGIDSFAARVRDLDVDSVAACLGPAGDGKDSLDKVSNIFGAMLRLQARSGHRVVAWRQGVLGPGLVAAGLDGYECGAGIGEQAKPTYLKNSHQKRGGGPGGIYLEPLGRSIPYTPARLLLGNMAMRPKVMCDVEACCPTVAATLDHPKQHAIRSRARQLDRLDRQPHSAWRLNDVAASARASHTLAVQANKVLADEYKTHDITSGPLVHPKTYQSLSEVCAAMSRQRQAS